RRAVPSGAAVAAAVAPAGVRAGRRLARERARKRLRQPEPAHDPDAAHSAGNSREGDDGVHDRLRDGDAARSARCGSDLERIRRAPAAGSDRRGAERDDGAALAERPARPRTCSRTCAGVILRNRSLLALIVAEVISGVGSRMTALALPWFVLVTTHSPAKMGLVLAAELLPMGVLGVSSGSGVSRLGARTTMLVSDFVRVPLMAAV